jgi:hypothetical protein
MYNKKNNGPRIEPCGTPNLTCFQCEKYWLDCLSLITTLWYLLFKYEVTNLKKYSSYLIKI